jgi:hypothetical protein
MKDLDLSQPVVRRKIRDRFGDTPPLDEIVITPETIFSASNLVTVYESQVE